MTDEIKQFLEAYEAWYEANVGSDGTVKTADIGTGGSSPPPPPTGK